MMEIKLLAHCPEHLETLAEWYVNEWGHLTGVDTIASETEKLKTFLNADKPPLIVVAIEDQNLLGAAQLKFHEMDIYPDKEHWLGGVYVDKNHRGKGIAQKIIEELIECAQKSNVSILYLQTEKMDGGLYKKLGWRALEKVNYHGDEVLVMKRRI